MALLWLLLQVVFWVAAAAAAVATLGLALVVLITAWTLDDQELEHRVGRESRPAV